jgi:hypothetical protein
VDSTAAVESPKLNWTAVDEIVVGSEQVTVNWVELPAIDLSISTFSQETPAIILNVMSRLSSTRAPVICLALLLILAQAGCEDQRSPRSAGADHEPGPGAGPSQPHRPPSAKPAPAAEHSSQRIPSKKASLGKDVSFETKGNRRRVLVAATVCLREGGLECLLCRSHTKEYESVLATDADAQVIHAALLAAGAKPGSPVQYVEKKGEVVVMPPTGSRIKIFIQYEDKGKLVTVPAQQWILNAKTKNDLEDEWVFAGSKLLPPEEENKKPIYAATSDGSYICIYNMPYALLDLSVNNPNKDPEVRELQPQTARIPPLGTKVTLILEPQADK